jgi:hypothetical protein
VGMSDWVDYWPDLYGGTRRAAHKLGHVVRLNLQCQDFANFSNKTSHGSQFTSAMGCDVTVLAVDFGY